MNAAPLPFTRTDWLLLAAIIAVGLIAVLIDPIGYIGGRWDDGRYLEAALHWRTLGHDHWALRWPVVLPAAAAIEAFGVNRAALMLPGLAVFAALLATIFTGVRALSADRAAATVAALSAASALAIANAATRLTADLPEALFWCLALFAFALAARAEERRQALWLIASGAACGLAWAARETALGLGIVLAVAFIAGWGPPRRRWVWLAAGALAVILPEQLLLWRASGDWLYRLHTDLRHIDIASTHLGGGAVAAGTRAALNPGMAARWDGAGPVHLWWAADPWVNLLLNPQYGLVFLGWAILWFLPFFRGGGPRASSARGGGASALAVVAAQEREDGAKARPSTAQEGGPPPQKWGGSNALLLIAAANVMTVVYIVATDPKPRMFLPAIIAGSIALGLLAVRAWRADRRGWVIGIGIAKLLVFAVGLTVATRFTAAPELAARALSGTSGTVGADRWTLSHLALAPPDVTQRLRPGNAGPLFLTIAKAADAPELPPGQWQHAATATTATPLALRLAAALHIRVKPPNATATLWRCVSGCAPLQGPPSVDVGQ